MAKQLGFGDYEQATANKRARRERCLAEIEKAVPWKALISLIDTHYPKTSSKGGRPPYPLATMLRIHLLQQWYDLRRLWKTNAFRGTMILGSQARTEVMGGKQLGFSDYKLTTAKKQTKREKFLAEMEAVVP